MSEAVHDRPAVLVTDASRGSAISIIRSLGRKGLRVVVADATPESLGFSSRFCAVKLVYPAPEHDPAGFVACILEAARREGVQLIIPVTDAAILPLSKAREQFKGVCELAIPEVAQLETVTNKGKTLELARQCGVPVPLTRLVHTRAEALAAAPEFGWPIVLKPQMSRKLLPADAAPEAQKGAAQAIEFFTVSYAANAAQLEEQMGRLEGHCPVLLQEYYPGEGCGVELLLHEGRPLAAFQHHRLREVPINGGASALRESVPLDPQMYDYSLKLMSALCWTGLAMVEFKVGKNGPKLMEINGRVWGSLPLAVISGMDFPGRLADLYFHGPGSASVPPATGYRRGVRARNLELDVLWILTVLKGKKRYPFLKMPSRAQGLKAALQLFNPAIKFDILTLQDLRPGLREMVKVVRKIGRKMKEASE